MSDNTFRPLISTDYKPLHTLLPLESPLTINIGTTTRCNFRCRFCYRVHLDTMEYGKDMPFQLLEKIACDVSDFEKPISQIELSCYGEPLLYLHISDAIALMKKNKKVKKVRITTNGSLLTQDKAEAFVAAGLDRIIISLNGLSDEQYKALTQTNIKSIYNTIKDNVKYMYSIRDKCHIHVKIIGNYFSQDEQKYFLDTFSEISDTVFVESLVNQWLNLTSIENTSQKELRNRFGYAMENKPICSQPFYYLSIGPDGMVSACGDDWEYIMSIGDVSKDPLVQIWNNKKISTLRKAHLTQTGIPEQCNNCSYYETQTSEDLAPYRKELIKKYGFV